MLYQSSETFSGANLATLIQTLSYAADDKNFLFPFIGGMLGLIGGMTVFLGGGGGATIAFCGGLVASGFYLATGHNFDIPNYHFWENEAAVGVSMLAIACLAGLMRAGGD